MRLLARGIENGEGYVVLQPDTAEDLWEVYNLVMIGDLVKSVTMRKVQSESATGSVSSSRVKMSLTIQVSGTHFDAAGGKVRVSGRNVVQSQHVRMGAYHTLDLEPNRKFTLEKTAWDSVALDRLRDATSIEKKADVCVVLMNDGLAFVFLISPSMTAVRAKIDVTVPRKRAFSSSHDKSLDRFFDQVSVAILRCVPWDLISCIVIASPGFTKDQFAEYLFAEAARREWKEILENKPKFMLVHSSSGFKHSLKEVLASPSVAARISSSQATGEVRALDRFMTLMMKDPDRCVYGPKHVAAAAEQLAIDTLLILDSLFRADDPSERRRYVDLVDSVKAGHGTVRVFSSLHVTGEQLEKYTGIAALLRYPMPDLDDSDNEGS